PAEIRLPAVESVTNKKSSVSSRLRGCLAPRTLTVGEADAPQRVAKRLHPSVAASPRAENTGCGAMELDPVTHGRVPRSSGMSDTLASRGAFDALSIPPEAKPTIRILVVDDERTLRDGCTSMLQADGYNVSSAGRGDEAIDMMRRSRFDIVLVDLH